MSNLPTKYDLSSRDLARGRNLKAAAIASPILLTAIPATVTGALFILFGSTPPVAASILFLGLIITALGFLKGMFLTGLFAYKYSNWSDEMREKIAADGIKPEEIGWFTKELKSNEKRKLKELERGDLLLADAYRETLASRLTATRIVKSSRRELQSAKRRESRLKALKSSNAEKFVTEIASDLEKLSSINAEAQEMLVEAESRLQMIEAAAVRGSDVANSELALKKLSARSAQLPLALEEAKMTEDIRKELEAELENK